MWWVREHFFRKRLCLNIVQRKHPLSEKSENIIGIPVIFNDLDEAGRGLEISGSYLVYKNGVLDIQSSGPRFIVIRLLINENK